jgi:hypothetical protein
MQSVSLHFQRFMSREVRIHVYIRLSHTIQPTNQPTADPPKAATFATPYQSCPHPNSLHVINSEASSPQKMLPCLFPRPKSKSNPSASTSTNPKTQPKPTMTGALLCEDCWSLTTDYFDRKKHPQQNPVPPGPESCDLCRLLRQAIETFRDSRPQLAGVDEGVFGGA